jgi:Fe-S-cluster-containing hydrogenase component 2
MLKGYYGLSEDDVLVVRDGDKLSLGSCDLIFHMTPMVHWPETMMTWLPAEKTLFSGDAFGTFGALKHGIKDTEYSYCGDKCTCDEGCICHDGISCEEETDEARTLASYYREAVQRDIPVNVSEKLPLSVCDAGCSECSSAKVIVTGNCRGCFSRRCMYKCPKGAISVVNQVSVIDYSKCVNCGQCVGVCPYNAIVKTTVPCENACPTGAIHKDEDGHTQIKPEKCISCGNCFSKCPFSAVMERSQMLDVMKALKNGEKVVAMIAPAAGSQIVGTIEQLFTAVSRLGFTDVIEVALGAEETTAREAAEFR